MNTTFPIYIINLERHADRRESLSRRLQELHLTQFEFIQAVDGRLLLESEISELCDRSAIIDRAGRDFTVGEIGCLLSHQKTYRTMLESDFDACMVLEDDVLINLKLPSILDGVYDWLGHSEPRVFLFSPVRAFLLNRSYHLMSDYSSAKVLKAWGAVGYAINRPAAENILRANSKIRFAADDWVSFERHANIEIRCAHPFLIWQDKGLQSSLEGDRALARHTKARTIRYRLNKIKDNISFGVLKWLYWRPFCGYREHQGYHKPSL